jgi:thymidylate synthase ThyX
MFSEDYEEFSDNQINQLNRYVTNTRSHVFALRNLPEVIKGALFSRYSRSSLGLRSLLLKDFIANSDEAGFDQIVGDAPKEDVGQQELAIKKAQNFYDRILDGYGDDSIGELGGGHLAVENLSMLAAKVIEDCRLGGSPLEKSTRYIYFDHKVHGEYLFYREPILMTSAYRSIYVDTCNMLFDTYSELIPPLTELMEQRFPKEPDVSKLAYAAALRAKVLDCLRGLLPAGTLTNMGVYGNGRFFETLIKKLHSHNLAELQDLGKKSYDELSKIIPSFVRRADLEHRHYQAAAKFQDSMLSGLKLMTDQHCSFSDRSTEPGVRLLDSDPKAVEKVVAALLFSHSDKGMEELTSYASELPDEEIHRILEVTCSPRENRRHKSPRALEHASFTFEIIADFGIYRDLQRHRTLTQDRQLLSCDYGYSISDDIKGTEIEAKYCEALDKAKEVFDTIAQELPEEAQYIVPMGYNIRWYFHINLRALQWLCELRSAPQGHHHYRYIAQRMAKDVCEKFPIFERFFRFVDYDGYEFGRLGQEQRKAEKQVSE